MSSTRKRASTRKINALRFRRAATRDAKALSALHTAAAAELTRVHGKGAWSTHQSEKGALFALRTSKVFVATEAGAIVGTFRFTTKKPWAIDVSYFTPCQTPLYLLGMAVAPGRQRRGISRKCLIEATRVAKAWPADAIRLDAFDSPAGAGGFYARYGYAERGRTSYRRTPLIYFELLLT